VPPHKSRHNYQLIYHYIRHSKEVSNIKNAKRYDEDFKRTLIELYHNRKTQTALVKEYGVSPTALNSWIKQYSTAETEND